MTTTVRRGAGRPAATARSNRHAQRTALPRRPEKAEDPKGTSEDVYAAVLPVATRSWGKANKFAGVVKPHGWDVAIAFAEGTELAEDIVEVTARRGTEVLWISWTCGAMTTEPMPTYTIADRTIKMRNASQCAKYAARPPEAATAELDRVSSNRAFRPKERTPKKARLPFDPATATDIEVIEALVGNRATWHNNRSQQEEDAIVGTDPRRVEIVMATGGDRIVKFCCPRTGFRAFKLSALLRVGGAPRVERRSGGRKVQTHDSKRKAA